MIKVTQVVQVVWVVQVVRVARTTSLDDMHSENIWFSWYKPSKYREKLICHACDGGGRRTDGKWKIGQCSVGPETAISIFIFSWLPAIGVANICFPVQFLAQLQSTHFVGRSEIWSKGAAQFKIWATPHRSG